MISPNYWPHPPQGQDYRGTAPICYHESVIQGATRKIFQTRVYGNSNQPVVFLLAGWLTKSWMYWLPATILAGSGYCCIAYAYDYDVFSPDAKRTVESLQAITNDVLAQIDRLKKLGHQEYSIVSFSLGTMIACMVADRSADVKKVVLMLTSNHPADAVWTWDKVRPAFKQGLLARGLTLASLRQMWDPIAPVNNLGNSKGKQYLVYLAARDTTAPFENGMKLVNKIKQSGCECQLVVNRHGSHAQAGMYNLAHARTYRAFLATGEVSAAH